MSLRACVTTAKGAAAIASIYLTGDNAHAIIKAIFQSPSSDDLHYDTGEILVGNIIDGNRIIDHAVVACLDDDSFEISCHGNPLIVEMIMKLLEDKGAQLVTAEEILKEHIASESKNAIATEAKLHQLKAVTIEGVKIIANQLNTGLKKTVSNWLANFDSLSLEQIANESKAILTRSHTAKLIINGCKAVLAGPPNSGKSTLLNCLAGKQKAIVTDVAGTTRDWVTATCRIGPILIELADTAGLDEKLKETTIDHKAQQKTTQLLTDCDLILWVIDGSRAADIEMIETDKPVLVILNKSDLGCVVDYHPAVQISAETGDGIEGLAEAIQEILEVSGFDLSAAVCFTPRQVELLSNLTEAIDKTTANSIITELLTGPLSV